MMIVDGFDISDDSEIYLIAEMSANHNGNIENAFKVLEDYSVKQAVKFL